MHSLHVIHSFVYDHSVVSRFRGGELVVIRVSECREYLSVYNESSFFPSSFGAAKVTFCFRQIFCVPRRLRADSDAYMSTQREVFEGQTTARRAKRGGLWKGVRGASPGNFHKPVLQMVQSELFPSYICQCN